MHFDVLMSLVILGLISFVFGWGASSILGAIADTVRRRWR
jgi:hypothetical protein